MSEKATRDFNYKNLKGCIENLSRECLEVEIEVDDLECVYQDVKESWNVYLQSHRAFVATITVSGTVGEATQAHKMATHEFETAGKLYKKTVRKI